VNYQKNIKLITDSEMAALYYLHYSIFTRKK